jgi:[ribosomal protein S5]-alanine N-acetyltransferase
MRAPLIDKKQFNMRSFTLLDAEPLNAILNDLEVIRYFPFKHPPTLEQTQRFVQQQIQHWMDHGYGWWALEDAESGRFIGWSGLQYLPELKQTEIGYLLARDFWGRGIATESAKAGLDFGFKDTELTTIIALVHPGNKASIHVLEKLKMKFQEQINLWEMDMLKYSIGKIEHSVDTGRV